MASEVFPVNIYTAVETVLKTSAYLVPYVDTVDIRKYRYPDMPEFSHHAIVISPMAATLIPYPAHQRFIENDIMLVLLVKVLYTARDAILAKYNSEDDPQPDPPKVGILAMFEDVVKTLYDNDLSGTIEKTPGLGMLDNRSDFNVLMDEDREGFYMEAKMYYSPRGHRFISLP